MRLRDISEAVKRPRKPWAPTKPMPIFTLWSSYGDVSVLVPSDGAYREYRYCTPAWLHDGWKRRLRSKPWEGWIVYNEVKAAAFKD